MTSASTIDGLAGMLTLSTLLRFLGLWIAYHVVRALYNISPMHPLSHIPGPKLAAMTLLYEFWYDMVLGGTYTQVIKRMHETYGKKKSIPTLWYRVPPLANASNGQAPVVMKIGH
jgi:hypothetical protein